MKTTIDDYIARHSLAPNKYYVIDVISNGKVLAKNEIVPTDAEHEVVIDELVRKTGPTSPGTWSNWWKQQRAAIFGTLGLATAGGLYWYLNRNQQSVANLPALRKP